MLAMIGLFLKNLTLKDIFNFVCYAALAGLVFGVYYYHSETKLLTAQIETLKVVQKNLIEENTKMAESIVNMSASAKVSENACAHLEIVNNKVDTQTQKIEGLIASKELDIRKAHTKIVKVTKPDNTVVDQAVEEPSDVVSEKDKEISAARIAGVWQIYCTNLDDGPPECAAVEKIKATE